MSCKALNPNSVHLGGGLRIALSDLFLTQCLFNFLSHCCLHSTCGFQLHVSVAILILMKGIASDVTAVLLIIISTIFFSLHSTLFLGRKVEVHDFGLRVEGLGFRVCIVGVGVLELNLGLSSSMWPMQTSGRGIYVATCSLIREWTLATRARLFGFYVL